MIEANITEASKNDNAQSLSRPYDVKIHNGAVYVVDQGKHRVLKMNEKMEWELVCGGKSRGSNDDQLDTPG